MSSHVEHRSSAWLAFAARPGLIRFRLHCMHADTSCWARAVEGDGLCPDHRYLATASADSVPHPMSQIFSASHPCGAITGSRNDATGDRYRRFAWWPTPPGFCCNRYFAPGAVPRPERSAWLREPSRYLSLWLCPWGPPHHDSLKRIHVVLRRRFGLARKADTSLCCTIARPGLVLPIPRCRALPSWAPCAASFLVRS